LKKQNKMPIQKDRTCRICKANCYGRYCRNCFENMKLGKGSNSRVNRTIRYRRKNNLSVGDVEGI